jgi:hypothetical protein
MLVVEIQEVLVAAAVAVLQEAAAVVVAAVVVMEDKQVAVVRWEIQEVIHLLGDKMVVLELHQETLILVLVGTLDLMASQEILVLKGLLENLVLVREVQEILLLEVQETHPLAEQEVLEQ